MKVERPWGSYEVISEGQGFKVKLVQVMPRMRLSLQSHKQRSEHWVVVEGTAKVTNGKATYHLEPNQSIYIPKEGIHRIENASEKVLKIVEVQCGNYLEEDDIQRYEDDFGRNF